MDSELNRPLSRNEVLALDKLKLKWKELSVEDIILDGLYLNCIRLVKEYFDKNLKIDLKPNKINDIGLRSVLQLLADKDLRGAETLLNHMKLDFNQKIYQICFFTPYKQLRDYLVSVLIERQKLNDTELEIIEYLRKLELAYPCRSFDDAKKQITHFRPLSVTWPGGSSQSNQNARNEFFICREIIRVKDKSGEATSGRYSHCVIEWIRDWSQRTKQEILVESLILNRDKASELQPIDDSVIWSTLLELNNLELIFEWIDWSFGETSDSSPSSNDDSNNKQDESTSNRKHNLFNEKLTQQMLDMIPITRTLPSYCKNQIMNYLAKYNKFCTHELEDFSLNVRRTSSAGAIYDKRLFKQRDDNLHLKFLLNFVKKTHIPVNLLWYYLNLYNKINSKKTSQSLLADSQFMEINTSSCLKLMTAFRQNLCLADLDPSSYFLNVSVKNLEHHLNQTDSLQISSLFSPKFKDHHLLAVAMSLYLDTPLTGAESAKLENLLEEYPSLRLIIDSKSSYQPPSLYTLLQEHTKLDISRFFSWQKSNNLSLFKHEGDKTKMTGSSAQNSQNHLSSLISFENVEFAKKFAYKDSLDYSYFLKRGRPFFAYYYFIQNQLKKYGKINKILMEEAKLRTNLILIESFQNERIFSACLIFSELVGADVFRLKLNVHLMSILTEHYRKRGMDESQAVEKCKDVFVEFFKDELDPKQIFSLIEHVIMTNIVENYDKQKMFTMDACSILLPLMCFSKLYNLPYSTKYLQLCAEANQWLMYLIFAQLYQIPRHQVISCLESFTDIGLKQHLEYALHNVIYSTHTNEPNSKMTNKLRDVFKRTESKLSNWFKGSRKTRKTKSTTVSASASTTTASHSPMASKSSTTNRTNESSENEDSEFEIDHKNTDEGKFQLQETFDSIDFYELLINCQNSVDPVLRLQIDAIKWHAPVLAVFATFYQNHDKISCLCTFLFASIKHHLSANKIKSLNEKSSDSHSILFGLGDLKEAIQIVACKSFLRTLLNAVRIFIPKTILDVYVEFLYTVFVRKDPTQGQKLHSNYKYELIKVTLNKHQSYIPLEWYEDVINQLTRITILKCHVIDDLNNLSQILGSTNEFRRLIKLVHTLKSNKISVNCDDWLDLEDKSEQFNEICFRVIEELLKMQRFNEAEELAEYCELSKDRIHLARIGRQIEMLRLNNDFEEILAFWKSAHIQLMKIGIKDSDFIDFLKFQNSRSNLTLERIVLLNLICQLCPNDLESSKNLWNLLLHFVIDYRKKNELNNLCEIFRKMLLFGRLKEDPVKELIEYVVKENRVNDFVDNATSLNEHDKESLNILLYNLVEIGKLAQAYVIAKHFKYFNQDFRILLNMIYICLDMVKPEDLDYSSQQTIDTTSFKGIKLTNVLRSLSRPSPSSNDFGPNESYKEKLSYLEKLVGLCKFGNRFSKRIKLDYQIANEILRTTINKVLAENEWNLLRLVLYSTNSNKFETAKEFVKVYDLKPKRLSEFILEELVITYRSYFAMNKNNYYSGLVSSSRGGQQQQSQIVLDPINDKEFAKLIAIFDQEINQFGMRMLERSRSLLNDAKSSSSSDDLNLLTELLIRAHNCFIQSCSMEGISIVLETCKLVAIRLEKAGEFNIMIRLLTGIAHFNEMTYIMDYLWNNHQFEMLFGKGIGKDEKLKLALMNYLKRYHPNDHETYTMVTLNFTMHREIATMLEEAAYERLKILENKPLDNTSETLTDLQSILQYFSDAAQSYMKEDCVKHSEACVRKARLIALQIQFLSSNIVIINLNSLLVTKFISSHTKFWEALIVSEAYEKKSDLPLGLFNQFIVNNNEKYFLDFKAHAQLNSSAIEEVTNRYKVRNESGKLSAQSAENMKRLLKCSKDLGQYYRLITSLDFKDLMTEMQTKKYSSIINDLIAIKKL